MNEQNTNNNERKHFKRTNGLNNVNSDLNKHLKLAQNVPNKKKPKIANTYLNVCIIKRN